MEWIAAGINIYSFGNYKTGYDRNRRWFGYIIRRLCISVYGHHVYIDDFAGYCVDWWIDIYPDGQEKPSDQNPIYPILVVGDLFL